MKEWYFPFNWEVADIWRLEGRLEKREVKELEWHLEIPFWSSERGKGMLFDLKPKEVLGNPEKHSYHSRRVIEADESYPIGLAEYKGREIIIDGIHRLAKLFSTGIETADVKVISEGSIKNIAKYA